MGTAVNTKPLEVARYGQALKMEEFRFGISDEVIKDVMKRVKLASWPRRAGDGGWGLGISHDFMRRFAEYWTTDFDWRKTEAQLNSWPQFRSAIGEINVHFYHVRGEGTAPRPLLLTHGWPGSILEFLPLIGRLTHPSRYGGQETDAFSVVIPSVPGFAASELPDGHIMGPVTTAKLWRTLMVDILGYDRFGVQGGDFGALVSSVIAGMYPNHVAALHLNAVTVEMGPFQDLDLAEKAYVEQCGQIATTEYGYVNVQAFKPNTIAFALAGNPLGTAAWILEKFYAWSDNQGDILDAFSLEQLCANVSLYALTDTMGSSIRFYEGFGREMGGMLYPASKIEVPTGAALFPRELLPLRPPRRMAERHYDIRRWTEMPHGGHFAALEQPDLLLSDIQAFFRDHL